MASLQLKRVYQAPEASDGTRILVDRLWPRGVTKEKAGIDLWLKDIAPSDALRKRFHGKPQDWNAFCVAYAEELETGTKQHAEGLRMNAGTSGCDIETKAGNRMGGPVDHGSL